MSADGERNFLPIVAIVIVVLFAGAITASVVVWRRQQLADAEARATSSPPTPLVIPTVTATATPEPVDLGKFGEPAPSAHVVERRSRDVGPHGNESVGALVDSSAIPNAEQAIARLRPGFRSCYNKGLANDPSMAGSITIAIKVAPSGDITDVTKKGGSGLSSDVEQCIIKRARNGTFDATPSGGTISVPIQFVRAN